MIEKMKLKDVGTVITGNTPSKKNKEYYNSNDINFFTPTDFEDGRINDFKESVNYISNHAKEKARILPKGSVLVTCIGIIGKVGITKKESAFNQQINAVIPNKDIIDNRYLAYWLISKADVLRKKANAPVVPIINKTDFQELDIDVPSIETQKEIVNKLNKIQEIIDIRKKQIEELEELIKSQFIEMFGDPNLNNMNWKEVKVIDVCDCMVPARDKPKSFTGEIPWITIEDLKVNSITYKSKSNLGLTEEEISTVKRKKIPTGSVVMSCVGNLGICSIAGKEIVINQQLHSFQCKEKINNIFLMYMLGERKSYMEKNASNTTVLYMNKLICNSIPIYLPPIELQNQFAEMVKQIDKQKFKIQKNLEEIQQLQESLMNQYFC